MHRLSHFVQFKIPSNKQFHRVQSTLSRLLQKAQKPRQRTLAREHGRKSRQHFYLNLTYYWKSE